MFTNASDYKPVCSLKDVLVNAKSWQWLKDQRGGRAGLQPPFHTLKAIFGPFIKINNNSNNNRRVVLRLCRIGTSGVTMRPSKQCSGKC